MTARDPGSIPSSETGPPASHSRRRFLALTGAAGVAATAAGLVLPTAAQAATPDRASAGSVDAVVPFAARGGRTPPRPSPRSGRRPFRWRSARRT